MTDELRAEILNTGNPFIRSVAIVINAPADTIFELLARPGEHHRFDGSGSVRDQASGPERLTLGAKFGMHMRIKVPYRIGNTVVEFDENRCIAWQHVGKHTWRYELEPIDEHTTRVVETFDGSTARFPPALKFMGALNANEKAMAKTLVRLKTLVEAT
jgi:hypothetical protein